LIAAVLTVRELRDLRELASSYGVAALVEVHNDYELEAAIDSGAAILGVNNRNLHTFDVDLGISLKLAERMPAHVIKVAESGIRSGADAHALRNAGFDAMLVGEHLMTAADPAGALRELLT
jgi:indole-3-glycerol phosphate synthase